VLPGGRPPAEPAAAAPGSAWLAALLTPWIVLGVSVAILVPGHAEPAGGAAAGS
jgi:hypothetical protein